MRACACVCEFSLLQTYGRCGIRNEAKSESNREEKRRERRQARREKRRVSWQEDVGGNTRFIDTIETRPGRIIFATKREKSDCFTMYCVSTLGGGKKATKVNLVRCFLRFTLFLCHVVRT